jgi:cell division protein FtsB
VAGGPEQVSPVTRVVIGAQRVRRAQPRGFEGLVDEPAEPVPASQGDEPAESSLAVGRRSVEHDAGHRLAPTAGIDALGDSRRAVSAFQRQLADQRVREGVQQDVPYARPFAGDQPPVGAPLVVTGGQDPAAHHDRGLAVIAAAEDPATSGPAGAGAVSRRSLLADNANLRDRNRRLEQHARSLEDRLSELLGTQISQRTGLGPPPDVAALKDQIQALQQENLDLRRHAEERDEELAAAREANRRLMTELNKARS